jgi:hypothetical protein
MKADELIKRRLRLPALAALAACLALPALGGAVAMAQEGDVEEEPLTIDVKRIVVPDTRQKLAQKGVRVKASCSQDCVLVVKIKLPQRIADQLGLDNRVIGSGAAGAKANTPRWVRARLNRGAGKLLEDYDGGGNLEIRVRGLP